MARGESEDQDDERLDVVVLRTLGAQPRRRRRSRPAAAGDQEPDPVPITRATVIAADAFADEEQARGWLSDARTDDGAAEIERALRCLNRAIRSHRLAAADPYVHEVSSRQARSVVIGYGTGEELVDGRWREAYSIPAEKLHRRQMLAPQQELAAMLSGRRPAQTSEDLVLRARLDVDQGRPRQAALQARAAGHALGAELRRTRELADDVVESVVGWLPKLDELAAAALEETLDDQQAAEVAEIVGGLERVARRRRHAAATR
jgi:hypothetical protein